MSINPQRIEVKPQEEQQQHVTGSYMFYENDSYLHQIFSQTKADTIIKIAFSKLFVITLIVLVLFCYVWMASFAEHWSFEEPHLDIRSWQLFSISVRIITIIWSSVGILSCNKYALSLIFGTFDCWFKMSQIVLYHCVVWYAAFWVYRDYWSYAGYYYVEDGMSSVWMWILTLQISTFDAISPSIISRKKQTIAICVNVLFYTWLALNYQHMLYHLDKNSLERFDINCGEYFSTNAIEIMASLSRNLWIFFAKQMILKILRSRNKEVIKPSMISYAPDICWISAEKGHYVEYPHSKRISITSTNAIV